MDRRTRYDVAYPGANDFGPVLPLGGVESGPAPDTRPSWTRGFRLERIVPTLCPQSIVEAVPV
jgi:hypothetical protein